LFTDCSDGGSYFYANVAAIFGLLLMMGAVLFGLAAAYAVPGERLAVRAIPLYLMETI
jgi:hypothetical protein